jgi:hypothetical protein
MPSKTALAEIRILGHSALELPEVKVRKKTGQNETVVNTLNVIVRCRNMIITVPGERDGAQYSD